MGLRIKRRVQQFRHGVKLLFSFLRTLPKVLKLRKQARAAGQKFIALSMPDVLGDIVSAEPTVRQVRLKFPEAHIYWIARNEFVDLMKYHPDLNGVISVLCFSEAYLL